MRASKGAEVSGRRETLRGSALASHDYTPASGTGSPDMLDVVKSVSDDNGNNPDGLRLIYPFVNVAGKHIGSSCSVSSPART